jgi:hypothetical protein
MSWFGWGVQCFAAISWHELLRTTFVHTVVTLFFKVIKLMAELEYLPSRQIACSQNVLCDPVLHKHKTHPLPEMCAEV